MRRREFAGAALAGLATLAGCSSGNESSTTGTDGTETDGNVRRGKGVRGDIRAVAAEPENPATTLRVRWHARFQGVIDPDGATERIASGGLSYVVFQFVIENRGDVAATVDPAMFQIGIEGTAYDYVAIDDPDSLQRTTIDPESSVTGWEVFDVPPGDMILAVYQGATPKTVAVEFERDPDLEFRLK